MANYSIGVLPESEVSITGGVTLDGVTQGDGSHLLGEFLTFGTGPTTTLDVSDGGADTNFDDNDGNQRLDGAQTLDGVTYANNTRIEAEYQFTLRDNSTGQTYQAIGVNIVNSSPAFGTIEGLVFIGAFPPRGIALEVISANEGPGSLGQPPIDTENLVPCFTKGTRILTPEGQIPIEKLKKDDVVVTAARREQKIRWAGHRKLQSFELTTMPRLRPIRIKAGALGCNLPARDLIVSRQHRMLLRSPIAKRMFGESEVLISAIKLTALPGILIDEQMEDVEYYHLLFDHHEIIFAENAPTESLLTGPEALKAVGQDARDEIATIFPQLRMLDYVPQPARQIPEGKRQKNLVQRHLRNHKPLICI